MEVSTTYKGFFLDCHHVRCIQFQSGDNSLLYLGKRSQLNRDMSLKAPGKACEWPWVEITCQTNIFKIKTAYSLSVITLIAVYKSNGK